MRHIFMTDVGVNKEEAPDSISSSLLELAKARDRAAWERLHALFSPLVLCWCSRAGLQAADAADVAQEVFRAVDRKIDKFRRDRPGDSFRGWLRTITRRKIADLFTRNPPGSIGEGGSDANKRWNQVPFPERDADEDPEIVRTDTRLLYERVLGLIRADFEERTLKAFWEFVVLARPARDVAKELGVKTNAVYLAKARVLRRLHTEFVDLIEA
jgi:RNA polymerase sigma-70 factor (ECF subfamily)